MKRCRGTGAGTVEPENRIGKVGRGEGKNCARSIFRHGKTKNYLNYSRGMMSL